MFGISSPVTEPPRNNIESRSLLTRKLMFTECFTVTPTATTANMTEATTEAPPTMNTIATEVPLNDEQIVELEESKARNKV